MDVGIKPVTWSTFLTTRTWCCSSLPNVTIPVNKWATLTKALFTRRPGPLCLRGHEDDICENLGLTISNLQCTFGAKPRYPPFSHCRAPLSAASVGVSLGSSAPVAPHHRHKRLLPNWFVSLSIKPRGYCCPPHLPLLEKMKARAYSLTHPLYLYLFDVLTAWRNVI